MSQVLSLFTLLPPGGADVFLRFATKPNAIYFVLSQPGYDPIRTMEWIEKMTNQVIVPVLTSQSLSLSARLLRYAVKITTLLS